MRESVLPGAGDPAADAGASIDVHAARRRIAADIANTPLVHSPSLSSVLGSELHLKLELRQKTGAFKERGALHALLRLPLGRRGVVTASAGNHGQGLAYHGARLGIPVTVVMPESTPLVKIEGVRRHGAAVVLVPGSFEAALSAAERLRVSHDLEMVPPFDDPDVIAGQGTIGLEIIEALPHLDVILVPVGGGGLLAGIASAVRGVAPHVQVVGVRTHGPTIAEGLNVARIGELPRRIIERLAVPLLIIGESLIREAMSLHSYHDQLVVEPAGAASLAAVLGYRQRFMNRRVALILSGGNVDRPLFASIVGGRPDDIQEVS